MQREQQTSPSDKPEISPRRRLEELRRIPEAARTEAQWDELNELEISFAPGNRAERDRDAPPGGGNPAARQRQTKPNSAENAPGRRGFRNRK